MALNPGTAVVVRVVCRPAVRAVYGDHATVLVVTDSVPNYGGTGRTCVFVTAEGRQLSLWRKQLHKARRSDYGAKL